MNNTVTKTNNTIEVDAFLKSSAYMKLASNVAPENIVSRLKQITKGVDFSNMTKEEKAKAKKAKILPNVKNKYKFRIFEKGLRVRDFSFFNCQIEKLNEKEIIFKFTNLGEERNEVIINERTDIYYCVSAGYICLNVKGPVYFADGTRRYENRRFDM